MKTLVPTLILTLASGVLGESGGPWSLTSSTYDGGGDSATGGVWQVTGTIGQPDATTQDALGSAWSLAGGFWPGAANLPDGPMLTVLPLDTTHVRLVWTAAAVGYKLQTSADLTQWADYPNGTITGPGFLNWPLQSGPRYFFRLTKP
jgi:hypothetical protein